MLSAKQRALRQFSGPTVAPLDPCGPGQPHQHSITANKVEGAIKLLHNVLTPGCNGVDNELLNYATGTVSKSFAEAIFEHHIALEALHKGILVVLTKPDKPLTRPLNSLHPIVLVSSVHKTLSTINVHHIHLKVSAFTGACLSCSRSCTDIT